MGEKKTPVQAFTEQTHQNKTKNQL